MNEEHEGEWGGEMPDCPACGGVHKHHYVAVRYECDLCGQYFVCGRRATSEYERLYGLQSEWLICSACQNEMVEGD
jgi:hypothetical protein